MAQTTERKLAAIMIADVAGFSRLMEKDESGTFARLHRLQEEVTHVKVVEYGGRIIKTTGDGFLAEFPSATAALKCGIDIQRTVVAREASQSAENRIRFRIGINVGDVIIDGSDVAGDGVNIAARLESMAPLDGLCISSSVRDQIRDVLGVSFEDMGDQKLKNISRPIRAYSVNTAGEITDHPAGSGTAGADGVDTLVVLSPQSAPWRGMNWLRARRRKLAIALVILIAVAAGAWRYWPAFHAAWGQDCAAERESFCGGIRGGRRIANCLDEHASELSARCLASRPAGLRPGRSNLPAGPRAEAIPRRAMQTNSPESGTEAVARPATSNNPPAPGAEAMPQPARSNNQTTGGAEHMEPTRSDWWQECTAEREKFCKDIPSGGGRIARCIDEHASELSERCIASLPVGARGARRRR